MGSTAAETGVAEGDEALASGNWEAARAAFENASCVATITSYEASQLQPGAVGAEVSALTTLAPGFVGDLVSKLARAHAGSIEGASKAEG